MLAFGVIGDVVGVVDVVISTISFVVVVEGAVVISTIGLLVVVVVVEFFASHGRQVGQARRNITFL